MPEQDTQSANNERYSRIRDVLVKVLLLNVAVASAKISVGFATSTLSLIADGFHSLLDGASNIVGLAGAAAASRPPDERHPYGHHKLETLASLIIGGLVVFTAIEIMQEAFYRIQAHRVPEAGLINIVVMVVTIIVNLGVTIYEGKAAKKYKSEILAADALQTRSDIFVSSGVLLAMAFIWMGYPLLDPIGAVLVTGAILYSAWLILHRAALVLSDSAALSVEDVRSAVMRVPGVLSVEKIRSRGNEQQVSVDLHIRVDPGITITEAHIITHEVRRSVEQATGASDVVIHTEPGGRCDL